MIIKETIEIIIKQEHKDHLVPLAQLVLKVHKGFKAHLAQQEVRQVHKALQAQQAYQVPKVNEDYLEQQELNE